jgi:hypothetical protein
VTLSHAEPHELVAVVTENCTGVEPGLVICNVWATGVVAPNCPVKANCAGLEVSAAVPVMPTFTVASTTVPPVPGAPNAIAA